ncbi:hypothetical protein SAMN05421736_11736 [Evansella caseinilytica]|uniref:Uncharacterized protein n=1 Tax=Evansella caseinilytica TaxID=1503961 RepID=A0A1H3U0K1_9BACI|nr:hypothetical protein [Evansella caseinilytica]SDZ55953.1 hypothetical protein SAMN05421736_11736 [Evansella caseinilytica]
MRDNATKRFARVYFSDFLNIHNIEFSAKVPGTLQDFKVLQSAWHLFIFFELNQYLSDKKETLFVQTLSVTIFRTYQLQYASPDWKQICTVSTFHKNESDYYHLQYNIFMNEIEWGLVSVNHQDGSFFKGLIWATILSIPLWLFIIIFITKIMF